MNKKILAVPIMALVLSLSTISLASAQVTNSTTTCSQDDIQNAKQQIVNIREKITQLRTQYYNDWQSEHNSGQYNGTWEQYSQEKLSSADVSQLKSDYMKYSSILKNCGVMGPQGYGNGMSRPNGMPIQNSNCTQQDITNARQEIATSEKQYSDLKTQIYQDYQQAQSSGYNGTFGQYAHDKMTNSTEISQIKATHDKYSSFLKSCYGGMPHGFGPRPNGMYQNMGQYHDKYQNMSQYGNMPRGIGLGASGGFQSMMNPPTQNVTNINPVDALSITSGGQGIPQWVKGVAGWWAEGKISDSDFVSAIKFLVQHGIIKI